MSKIAKYLRILREPAPVDKELYIQWLEQRVDALVSLRLLEMGRYVNKAVNTKVRHRMEIDALREEIAELESPQEEVLEIKNKPRKPKTKHGYVYLLKVHNSKNLYKIGRTVNPNNRIRTFSVKLPFVVSYEHLIKCSNMYSLEYKLHKKYRKQRQNGSEFFILSDKDVMFIKSVENEADVKVDYPSFPTSPQDGTR